MAPSAGTSTVAPVRFGFLGVGGIVHRALLPAVRAADGVVLQAAAARDVSRAAAISPVGRSYGDYESLLADDSVDVVYISLPNDAHRPWTLAALAAGKHVLCEKPLGLGEAEVREMHAAATSADRFLVEAFWYRWHPRTRRLVELAEDGFFGPITTIETDFSFDADWSGPAADDIRLDPAKGGGALYDVGCYAASAALAVLGSPAAPTLAVREVSAVRSDRGVDLRTSASLESASGARVTLGCGIHGTSRQVISVTGTAGSASFPGTDAFTNQHEPASLVLRGADDAAPREESFGAVDPYRLMVESVAAAVRGEPAFLVDAAHSIAVAKVLDAIRAGA